MLQKLKQEIQKYFNNVDIEFEEITSGRTNTNYFIKLGEKEYFLRTNITKVIDSEFGGKLKKESNIYEALKGKGIIPGIIYYFNDNEGLQFIITEKLEGNAPIHFRENQDKVFSLLRKFQQIDYNTLDFLDRFHILFDFKKILEERLSNVNIPELKKILLEMTNYLYNTTWNFEEELSLCHNDFRSDNIIVSDIEAKLIDLESLIISDKYIDLAEYYIGGIFWNNFIDEKQFNYDNYKKYMDSFGYLDIEKQKYIFIMKFCSNFAWLSSHISQEEKPLQIYLDTLEQNKHNYYSSIKKLLK